MPTTEIFRLSFGGTLSGKILFGNECSNSYAPALTPRIGYHRMIWEYSLARITILPARPSKNEMQDTVTVDPVFEPKFDSTISEAIQRSLLAALSDHSRDRVLEGSIRVDIPAGSVIYREDDEPRCALVVEGLVRVFMTAPSGRQVTVRYAHSGEILGVPTIVGGPAPVNVQIMTNAIFLFLNVTALRDLGHNEPGVGWLLGQEITGRLYDTLEGLAAATFGSLRQRVARNLLDLASISGDGATLDVHVSQQELADAVGSVRPAVARVIGELKDQGLVEISPGRISIPRPIALHAQAWAREV